MPAGINASTVTAGNCVLTGPNGEKPEVSLVSYDPATGHGIYSASVTWSYLMNGLWSWTSSAMNAVQDLSGNVVPGNQLLGSFGVNCPVPSDIIQPQAAMVNSIDDITTPGLLSVHADIHYTDTE